MNNAGSVKHEASVGSFRGEASFTRWLYRLAINQVNMHFRDRRSRPEAYTSEKEIPERRPGRQGLTDPAELSIDRLAIENAVRMLPPGYRSAFILHDVEGHEHSEIARMTDRKAGTSKAQLHKARARLREMLANPAPVLQT